MAASWWWSGELADEEGVSAYPVLFETHARGADSHAELRVSISDGLCAWTAVVTNMELLLPCASATASAVTQIMSLLDSGKSRELRVKGADEASGPEIQVTFRGSVGAQVKFARGAKVPIDSFVAALMPYLELVGANTVDEEVALRTAREGQAGALAVLNRDLEAKEAFNRDLARRMRLLLIAKRDRNRPAGL
jgi:hypothetical protein